MLQKYEKYDYRVQLMRIFACLIVIGCHVRLEPVINGGLDKELLLLHGFFDDGVTIFFLIIGFFLPAVKEPLWKYVGKTFLRILIPVFFLMLCTQLLSGWIMNEATLAECLVHPSVDFAGIFKSFVTLNFLEGEYCSHLWYVTSYLRIVIILPLLRLLTPDTPLSAKVCRWFLFINVTGMLVTDLQALLPPAAGTAGIFMIFDVSATYVVAGYVVYKYHRLFQNNMRYRILFLAGMAGIQIIRFGLQCVLFGRSLENNYFYYWNTTVSLVFSVCFAGFFLTFPEGAGHPWQKIVSCLGAKTYFIYLCHIAVYTFLDHRGVRSRIYSVTVGAAPNLAAKACYDVIYPVVIFVCCLLIAVCVDCIKTLILSGIKAFSR